MYLEYSFFILKEEPQLDRLRISLPCSLVMFFKNFSKNKFSNNRGLTTSKFSHFGSNIKISVWKLYLESKNFLQEHIASIIDGDLIPLVYHLQSVHERTFWVFVSLIHVIVEIVFKDIWMVSVINEKENMFKNHAEICSTIIKRILRETRSMKKVILK